MEKNDQIFTARRIREQYVERESTELDELRALDARVKRPATLFGYIFGGVGAIVMGSGMSLVMTEIGATLGIQSAMPIGIAVGAVGLVMALVNYPIYKRIISSRRKKHASEILAASEKIINK